MFGAQCFLLVLAKRAHEFVEWRQGFQWIQIIGQLCLFCEQELAPFIISVGRYPGLGWPFALSIGSLIALRLR